MNCLTEIVPVLTEFRPVTRQLEADQHVTLSRSPRVLVELYETMQIMAGDMVPSITMFYDLSTAANVHSFFFPEPSARPPVPSAARYDKERDNAMRIRLVKPAAEQLCRRLCDSLNLRLADIWPPASSTSAAWHLTSSLASDALSQSLVRKERRVILFHLAAILEVIECELDFLGESESAREGYFSLLYYSLIGELRALDDTVSISGSSLQVLFELFHNEMRTSLKRDGRKESDEALHYWRRANECANLVSTVPFNMLARAFLASQASSAAAERLFSDLGRREGSQSQSLLSSTTEMCELVRVFVRNELCCMGKEQSGMLHPKGESFTKVVRRIATLVWDDLEDSHQ
ncbi:hypothetical protein FGB62_357g02 [Gracilaria domingensis]|nr:hypothetical protein FGB62_357g02 [Gracilaria domingensis]